MKAFILAAGLGTRLRPLTENQPKVMVEVAGKKILERTIGQLKEAGVDDLIINTHYFPEAVTNYFGDGSKWGVKIQYSFEPEILGTAGGLKKVEAYFKTEKELLIIYGDNVFDLDFKKIISAPLIGSCMAVLFDRTKSPNSGIAGGVVEVEDGMISGFFEGVNFVRSQSRQVGTAGAQARQTSNGVNRPEIPYVNGGVYKCSAEIFNYIPQNQFYDFGKQVFPEMLKRGAPLQAYVIGAEEALFGVDNMECLERANKYFDATFNN